MSLRRDDLDDAQDDALGLASTYPRPGWVVLDAIRDRGFTGEVVCRTNPGVTVWADRGVIYLAERDDDPSLGRRLVEAGALTEGQLAAGAVQVSGDEHLGLLFERVADVDRHAVIVTNQLLTDDCVGWLASQRVHGAIVTPYRHHASGAHRWHDDGAPGAPDGGLPAPSIGPVPGPTPSFAPPPPASVPATLPPPAPFTLPAPGTEEPPPLPPAHAAAPVTSLIAPLPMPGRRVDHVAEQVDVRVDLDDVIHWDEPGWLERPFANDPSEARARPAVESSPSLASAPTQAMGIDVSWTDRIDPPRASVSHHEPMARAAVLPAVAADPFDRFEVIWPSGEIDEQFGGQPLEAYPDPDIDRAGPTARLVRDGGQRDGTAGAGRVGDVADAVVEHALGDGVAGIESFLADQAVWSNTTEVVDHDDDVLSAVREAVAEIETGSLAQRERRIGPRSGIVIDSGAAPAELRLPGRVALRDTVEVPVTATGRMTRPNSTVGSVFDELPAAQPTEPIEVFVSVDEGAPVDERASALRRLIGSLKRR